ncbi:Ankyrin repeat-containing protein [Paenibacillus sp. yr247]|uniref:ankyrin repeat domain-containing protein n=1 Tax=Paenibacillus sp. yr247 TaxID=1761880 RepID=UPI00088355F0|nr:ankyrin repeat domain-containing protein [Paenibacillus sp. yr247]SDO88927.1 Ankyrin repeat-containing protein [Paenibacillus sp. yr247]
MKGQSKELNGIVAILLNKGIDPNIVFEVGDKRSLIIDAASSNNFEIVKLLVQYRANVNSYDINVKTALYSNLNLYSEGNVEIAKFLLDNGADPYIQSTYGIAQN